MANTTEEMKAAADKAAQDARSGAEELASAAREKATDFAHDARDRAYEYGRETKNATADETSKVADALRKASSDLRDGSPQEKIFARLADGVADTADQMRGMELDEMAYELTSFARRNPAAFLGGAALLGFAAGRFLKSSARGDHYDDPVDRGNVAPMAARSAPPPAPAPATTPAPGGPVPPAPSATAPARGGATAAPVGTTTAGGGVK
ncbi:hypothetical protein EKE94_05555 [Mesobaculum littorinae]|uniref:Late embryogenesis abundant protein n=1 Tax=Mesobaculum littorinae TaxID=2486419 RepID=A0A438AI54_9RHOB|nr:hypothetical protein [Mesobaculum littorinae]RVV98389.1 hypothetical protein EKE94_05555 [Mesobaculum littorinae]